MKMPVYLYSVCVLLVLYVMWQAGSFGTREDVVFFLASRLSREKGLPR